MTFTSSPVAVADHQCSESSAEAEQNEAVLAVRIVGVFLQERAFVVEDTSRLLERDAVLPLVRGVLGVVPLEPEVGHGVQSNYAVATPQDAHKAIDLTACA